MKNKYNILKYKKICKKWKYFVQNMQKYFEICKNMQNVKWLMQTF